MTGPVIEADGSKYWYKDGELHREDGPAIEHANGSKYWFKNGLQHRDGGPAIEEANGSKCWIKDGKFHREDGPAVEDADGTVEYWLFNEQYSYDEWKFWSRLSSEAIK